MKISINDIPQEILLLIMDHLTDREKLNLIECSKYANTLKNKFSLNEQHYYCTMIGKLSYYNRFTNLMLSQLITLPIGITHLIFGNNFNKAIKGAIPNSVTHLTIPKRYVNYITKHMANINFVDYLS